MKALTLDRTPYNAGMDQVKITGFCDGEMSELKSMEHNEAREALIDMLNRRNQNTGTCLAYGNGIYGLWFDNEAAYLSIGKTCD